MKKNKKQGKEQIGRPDKQPQKPPAQPKEARQGKVPIWVLGIGFFLTEAFAFCFLKTDGDFWPLVFGAIWAVLLTGIIRVLPSKAGRITFGVFYFAGLVYAGFETGYYLLFQEMMWLSEFRYAAEGSDYAGVLFSYPLGWWLGLIGLIGFGIVSIWKFPRWKKNILLSATAALLAAAAVVGAVLLPQAVFVHDKQIRYAGSDYGRAQSAEAAYDNMFNTHRLYQVCGLYQTLVKDVYTNELYPITPGYTKAQAENRAQIDAYFAERPEPADNEMTGIFAGKNVVLVLMESMDDWMLGAHTPTINRLMDEGINFENFYTPPYGGVRTFNSEFCLNTGSFLTTQGGYAFDYVTNDYSQSLASLLKQEGYSSIVYHYNDPSFYSRGVFSPAMGYDKYLTYQDYVTEETEKDLYSDQFLFDYDQVRESFFREGQKLNFIITRSAHLSYKYNEVLSYWALKQYPEYRGLTGHEEMDCAYLKAKLVDDMFARLLAELEANGELEDTVIVAMTDHYTYGVDDQEMVLAESGVSDELLVERTPCFIWSASGPDLDVEKTLNTSDLLPTLLNMLGIDSPYRYIGQDAFDSAYMGYALFPNGSWVSGDTAYNAENDTLLLLNGSTQAPSAEFQSQMAKIVQEFVRINNLILETNYYKE